MTHNSSHSAGIEHGLSSVLARLSGHKAQAVYTLLSWSHLGRSNTYYRVQSTNSLTPKKGESKVTVERDSHIRTGKVGICVQRGNKLTIWLTILPRLPLGSLRAKFSGGHCSQTTQLFIWVFIPWFRFLNDTFLNLNHRVRSSHTNLCRAYVLMQISQSIWT